MQSKIMLNNYKKIPLLDELTEVMWKKGVNVSRMGTYQHLLEGEEICLSWDKWLDDKRWSGHPKFKEYIYFTLKRNEDDLTGEIVIEVDDDATCTDKRAFYVASHHIAVKCDGLIFLETSGWSSPEQYRQAYDEYFITFEDANEVSLNNSL